MALAKAIAANRFAIAAAVACAGLVVVFPIAMTGTASSVDRLGVKQIYPTKPGGREWFLNATDPRDGLVVSPAATTIYNKSGSWQVGRITTGPNDGLRMYVISPDGWQNVEMTGYVKLKSFSFDEEFAWAARSGKHSASNPCDATAYFGALGFSGRAWFQKKIFHGEGYTDKRYSNQIVEPLQGRWVGIKLIAYNMEQGVKLELWVDDKADNSWAKVAETTDSGGWSSKVESCGEEADHMISEPRPRVMFRVDNAIFGFKNLSVREIDPQCYSGAIPFCA